MCFETTVIQFSPYNFSLINNVYFSDEHISWKEFLAHVDESKIMRRDDHKRTLSEERDMRLDFKMADQDNDDTLDWWEFLNHQAKIILATRPKVRVIARNFKLRNTTSHYLKTLNCLRSPHVFALYLTLRFEIMAGAQSYFWKKREKTTTLLQVYPLTGILGALVDY